MGIGIKNVTPLSEHRIEVTLDNGHSVTLDFTGKLHTVRFGQLKDKDFFRGVTTDGAFVRWSGLVEISLGEVFEIAQKEADFYEKNI